MIILKWAMHVEGPPGRKYRVEKSVIFWIACKTAKDAQNDASLTADDYD